MATKVTTKTGPKGIPAPKPRAAVSTSADTAEGHEGTSEVEAGSDKPSAMKLRELVDRVVDASGAKKKVVKEIVEATLAQLGQALAKGEELNLPGVGKIRVAKSADRQGRAMMTLKVRAAGAPKPKEPKVALAEAGEDV